MSLKSIDSFPEHIILFGGGRWAKVYLEVLVQILPKDTFISVFSPNNYQGMKQWIEKTIGKQRVVAVAELPEPEQNIYTVVLVVNRMKDHANRITWAIENNLPVLVEKPVCPDYSTALTLDLLAADSGQCLAASHIFLFSTYLENFKKVISKSIEEVQTVSIDWCDTNSEIRYNETQSYDSAVPVYLDCFPHIISILSYLFNTPEFELCEINVSRGGAELQLQLLINHTCHCDVRIERNSNYRKRKISVTSSVDNLILDFSSEPGFIMANGEENSADPEWLINEKPLAKMLKQFFNNIKSENLDARLGMSLAIEGLRLINEIEPLYRQNLSDWFEKQMPHSQDNADIKYAMTEINSRQE
jgi:hypothetical protein